MDFDIVNDQRTYRQCKKYVKYVFKLIKDNNNKKKHTEKTLKLNRKLKNFDFEDIIREQKNYLYCLRLQQKKLFIGDF